MPRPVMHDQKFAVGECLPDEVANRIGQNGRMVTARDTQATAHRGVAQRSKRRDGRRCMPPAIS